MEKDIKILENYIYNKKETMKEILVKSISNLLKAYKNLKAELKKKDSEIERYKMMLAETHARFLNSDLKTKRKNDEDLLMLNEGWKMELKKKEKTIKNMAKKLNQAYFEEDKFCQWFEKEVMQVQEKPDYGYVADLIKEYFERKAGK